MTFKALAFSSALAFTLQMTQVTQAADLASMDHDTSSFQPIFDYPDLFPMDLCHGFKLEEATLDQMQQAMTDNRLTSVQLVECYMARTYQTSEYINSILQLNPDALSIAATMDQERKDGHVRSVLHGIPFTVKDVFATKDKMETTAGSWALLGSIVPRDAHVVSKLREAGAVLLGKSTLSEWADMRSSNYSEGYSARGGQCRSAYNLTQNPGGSSSGSAVGVGANAIAFSLGTETDGSVINPASRNSIVGFKPTVGLTSRAGVVPESEHQDSVGAFGKSVRDAVSVLDIIYGADNRDAYTADQVGKVPDDGFSQFLVDKTALKDATFGLPWQSYWRHADEEQLEILKQVLSLIAQAGATIINGTEIEDYQNIVNPQGWNWDWLPPNQSEITVVKVDFYNNIKTYLSELSNTNIRSLEDVVQYNYDNDGSEGGYPWPLGHPAFYSGQDVFEASLETKGVHDETYLQALHFCQSKSRKGIDGALTYKGTKLNGLLVPPAVGLSYQQSAQAGYPVVTIPVGVSSESGMPFGLAILQTAWADAELVKYASAIQDAIKCSEFGRFKPTWRGYRERNIPVPF